MTFVSKCRTSTILFVLLVVLSGCNQNPLFKKAAEWSDREISRQVENAVSEDPKLQELDALCKAVPMPASAVFLRYGGLDDQTVSLWSYYATNESFDHLAAAWDPYFSQNGWKTVDRNYSSVSKILEFEKEGYRINIQYGGMGSSANVSLGCTKNEKK